MPKSEFQKYGAPLYAVYWVDEYAYMCGGGNLGIENKIVVTRCVDGILSDEIAKLNVGNDAPYRMALHPSGKSLIIGLTLGGIKRVDIHRPITEGKEQEPPKLTLAGPEFEVKGSTFGPIKSLSFSCDGRILALGGEDGMVDVISWPSMETIKRWRASSKAIRNVDFSGAHSDGVLAIVDESGSCALWDVKRGELITELIPPSDLPRAAFFRCQSVLDENGIALYTPIRFKGRGFVLRWRQGEDGTIRLEHRSPKPVTPVPICGFQSSHSGRLLAAVTPDGDQCIISASSLMPIKYRKRAHMTFATAVAFAPDDSAILSTSADASATITTIKERDFNVMGIGSVMILLGILIVLLSLILGMVRRFAESSPDEARDLMASAPVWMQSIVSAYLGWSGRREFQQV